jgi:hypothetical protein
MQGMPERPLLKLPEPQPFPPRPGPRGGTNIVKPARDRQSERMAPRFARLMQVVDTPERLLDLRNDPASIAPERAIVFEVAGSLSDFYAQAGSLGLEYLGDFEDAIDPTDDFFDEDHPDRQIAGRIYLAMPDVRALGELLSLWNRYTSSQRMPAGRSAWRELFSLLVDVRPWGPQDRVPAETIEFWRDSLAGNPNAPVRFEIELWYYESAEKRAAARQRLLDELRALGGTSVHSATINEIRYEALLVDVPADQVQRLIDHPDVGLARADEIMFLRPQSIARHRAKDELEGQQGPAPAQQVDLPNDPIAALIDGFPIQNHARLVGRLVIDDPNNLEPGYAVNQREHGTSMASLIVHGDLNYNDAPISRRLFVLPVMTPDANGNERTPPDQLLVDVICRAVRRIKEGEGQQPPSAPSVNIINVSLGDEWRPFARVMSPLGRLLDYLAHRYRVLFLVSAGNVLERLHIPDFNTSREFEDARPEDRERAILAALNQNKSNRTLFSPAEAINILTIGAAHAGSAYTGAFPANLVDPFTDPELPNIVSAMGLGFRKTVKPDLLFEGGRAPVRVVQSGDGVTVAPSNSPRLFGAKVAFPDRQGGLRYEDFSWGTSVATALATHAAHQIHDVLLDGEGGSNHTDIPAEYLALTIKALLVHGARWGTKGEMLEQFFGPRGPGSHSQRRDNIARLLGYGVPQIDRVLDCAENRATLLGYGAIAPGAGLLYRIPLPDGLSHWIRRRKL